MATLTLTYDARNKTARAIVDMIRSLDVFTVTEPATKSKKLQRSGDGNDKSKATMNNSIS